MGSRGHLSRCAGFFADECAGNKLSYELVRKKEDAAYGRDAPVSSLSD